VVYTLHKSFDNLKITLLNVGYADLSHKWDYDNVISPYSRLYYITDGTAKVYHNNTAYVLKPDYLYLIPSYTYSRYKCDEHMSQYYISVMDEIGQSFSMYNFYEFQYEVQAIPGDRDLFERLLTINPNRNLVREDPKVYDNRPTLLSFIERNKELSSSAMLETQGIIKVLFSRFLKDESAPSKKSIWNERILETVRYIHENLPHVLLVEDLARRCHLTPDHFSRLFLESTGQRPIKYIQHKRIERAQLLLTTTANSLQTIAEKVGLENISYFSRLFKKETGKTAGEFRREHWA
jgi:AraC-like DNA-binding protein